jgi:hypothetical protein
VDEGQIVGKAITHGDDTGDADLQAAIKMSVNHLHPEQEQEQEQKQEQKQEQDQDQEQEQEQEQDQKQPEEEAKQEKNEVASTNKVLPPHATARIIDTVVTPVTGWACTVCTFVNQTTPAPVPGGQSKSDHLGAVCEMCGTLSSHSTPAEAPHGPSRTLAPDCSSNLASAPASVVPVSLDLEPGSRAERMHLALLELVETTRNHPTASR